MSRLKILWKVLFLKIRLTGWIIRAVSGFRLDAFFDRKEYEQYQASLSQYKPNVPLLNPSSSMTQHSELKVTFENAPPGMKIIDVPGKADPLMKITHDVGYSPFRFPR